jgi:hypothetical protein
LPTMVNTPMIQRKARWTPWEIRSENEDTPELQPNHSGMILLTHDDGNLTIDCYKPSESG